jgi:hypothetical protein
MKWFTLITKGNKVTQFDTVDHVKPTDDAIVITSVGEIIVNKGNPITWPTDATNGLQAIVDVKAGTLFFIKDYVCQVNEFVVSEYVEPFVSVEDCDPATVKQSAPKGKGNPILGMVLADLTNRALEGKEKYGEPLLANNGRNALWDAYQEALDLAMYLRQAIEEQERS